MKLSISMAVVALAIFSNTAAAAVAKRDLFGPETKASVKRDHNIFAGGDSAAMVKRGDLFARSFGGESSSTCKCVTDCTNNCENMPESDAQVACMLQCPNACGGFSVNSNCFCCADNINHWGPNGGAACANYGGMVSC